MNIIRLPALTRAKCSNVKCPYHKDGMAYIIQYKVEENSSGILVSREPPRPYCHKCGRKMHYEREITLLRYGKPFNRLPYKTYEDGWIIRFTEARIASQVYNTDNEHLTSTVDFLIKRMDEPEDKYVPMQCIIRQPAGESFSFKTSPVEVEMPDALKGRVVYSEFAEVAEEYFKFLINNTLERSIGSIGPDTVVELENVEIKDYSPAVIHNRDTAGHGDW